MTDPVERAYAFYMRQKSAVWNQIAELWQGLYLRIEPHLLDVFRAGYDAANGSRFNEDLSEAPRDGTFLLLLVSGGLERPAISESEDYITMGMNLMGYTGVDRWQCMGYDTSHDSICELAPSAISGWLRPEWDMMSRQLTLHRKEEPK